MFTVLICEPFSACWNRTPVQLKFLLQIFLGIGFSLHITLQILLPRVTELPGDRDRHTFQIPAVPALCWNVIESGGVQVRSRTLRRSDTIPGSSAGLFLKGKESSAPWTRQNSTLTYFSFTHCPSSKGMRASEGSKERGLETTWAKIDW